MSRRSVALMFCLTIGWVGCNPQSSHDSSSRPQLRTDQLGGNPILLPTGASITPLAARGATFQSLNPGLPSRPDFIAGQAVTTALGPDGRTLPVLTSGYNRNNGPDGTTIPSESNEYVFIFDASVDPPAQRQVLQISNTFDGLACSPAGDAFLVTGGPDDNVHIFRQQGGVWAESLPAIALGHRNCGEPFCGLGLQVQPQAAGIAVNASGTRAVVANFENDSVTVLDLNARSRAEVELRPGRIDSAQRGVAGGEFPLWVAIRGDDKAYVSSTRDREVVVIDLQSSPPQVASRIAVGGQPNRMILNHSQSRLFVSNGTSDAVSVIDTSTEQIVEQIATVAPRELFPNQRGWKGANPNSLALSPDERTLYVTNGGTNSIAVARLGRASGPGAEDEPEDDAGESGQSRVVGLIPTGWYPNSISLSPTGDRLFVANGKSVPGPNEGACRDTLSTDSAALIRCRSHNQYVLQLEKGGLLSLPVPSGRELVQLTRASRDQQPLPGSTRHLRRAGDGIFAQSDSSRDLHHQREPNLRSGSRRPRSWKWRSGPDALPREDRPQSPRAGETVRDPRCVF